MILTTLFCLSRRVLMVPLAVEFYVFCIYLRSNNQILHCIDCTSHCMCSVSIINQYIGKWVYLRIHLLLLYCVPCSLLSDPNTVSKHLHRIFLRLFEKHIDRWFFWHCVIDLIHQERNTLHWLDAINKIVFLKSSMKWHLPLYWFIAKIQFFPVV